MDYLISAFTWFTNNILAKPEFFVGIIVLLGYALLGKKWYECIAGFIKATVGYMILNIGAGGLVTTFRPILAGLNDRFGLGAVVIDPYFGLNAVTGAMKDIGVSASWTMISLLIAFGLNILLVLLRKFTKIRTLFITGHIMVQQAATITWIIFYLFPQYQNLTGGMIVGLIAGLYWAVSSNLTVGATQNLTGGAGFAIGHQQMFAVWLTDKISPKLGDPEKNLENIKLPKFLSVFHDNVVATGVLMLAFFGIIMAILGEPYLRTAGLAVAKAGGSNPFPATISFPTYIVSQSLLFAVYLTILMQGVRMFVSELTVSFQGISNKILPGALPAVDCAATYGFAPGNAVLLGFLVGAIGQFIAIIGLIVFKSPVFIITGFVPVFFDNATIAVFANKRGGTRAALITTFASGVIQVLGGAFAAAFFGLTKYGGWHGNIDFEIFWPWAGMVMKYAGVVGIVLVALFFLAIPQLQYWKAKDKGAYDRGEI